MPIQILPARLANQIAAGEVVERPASVVKELIENSLDSGATFIEIEIEKGGHKRILIRDNGSGIPHNELGLALSRHATSKISSLDELEHIASLGFRGEALASISSVARLTLSSKPADQQDAWQAHCEGRDMEVKLNPVAHPNGTSVDVSDLFFNTPARRKFLRAEKTEFTHIDEIIRRIALSRFNVGFNLKHNGKLVRKYALANSEQAKLKRLVAICGKDFSEQAIELNSQYQDFHLNGWLAPPQTAKSQVDCQYFYVNGRMMRDKLLNHAVRQALEGIIAPEHQLAYVLYFNLELNQVDVNVHPAKHEVRFHQSRLVHDFIFRALSDALNQYFTEDHELTKPSQDLSPVAPNHDYIQPLIQQVEPQVNETQLANASHSSSNTQSVANYKSRSGNYAGSAGGNLSANVAKASHAYQALMSPAVNNKTRESETCLKVSEQHLLVKEGGQFYLLAIQRVLEHYLTHTYSHGMPVSQPLLLPISIEGDSDLLHRAKMYQTVLLELHIDIAWQGKRIILRKIPAGMRHYDWSKVLTRLLMTEEPELIQLKQTLVSSLAKQQINISDVELQSLWQNYCQLTNLPLAQRLAEEGKQIPLQQWLKQYV